MRIVGVDPYGSILGGGTEVHSYKVEGIGYDFIPDVLDRSVVDEGIKVTDRDRSLRRGGSPARGAARRGSSGSCMWAAMQVARRSKGTRILCLLPDSVRNYLTSPWTTAGCARTGRRDGRAVNMVGEVLRSCRRASCTRPRSATSWRTP